MANIFPVNMSGNLKIGSQIIIILTFDHLHIINRNSVLQDICSEYPGGG